MTGATIRLRPPAMAADLDAIGALIDAAPALTHRIDASWRLASLALRSRNDPDLTPAPAGFTVRPFRVETDGTRTPARRDYESAGFRWRTP